MRKSFAHLLFIPFLFQFYSNSCFGQNQTELWGMTTYGDGGGGVIFKTDNSGNNLQYMYSFLENQGKYPNADLCQASNGKFYGMTEEGGVNNNGVLFEYDPVTIIYSKKLDFESITSGSNPKGSLIQASNGRLYGMTYYGGANNYGVLFEYDILTCAYTKKVDFTGLLNGNGGCPYGSLLEASNGKLYGLTSSGGVYGTGVLFEYDPATSTFTKKLDFDSDSRGSYPYGSLIQATNGKLYGMTAEGGVDYYGVLFEYDLSTSTYTKKLDFNGETTGGYPSGSLVQATNGKLYGITSVGGINNLGVLFEFDPATSSYIKKLDFNGESNGRQSNCSLIQASDGQLYGMTPAGGIYDSGVLFRYDPATSTYNKMIDFDNGPDGGYPLGSLLQATDGKLYGMTKTGGFSGYGVLFEYYTATGTYTKRLEFESKINGINPYGSLIQASDGKLYGMTLSGGTNDDGVLFEYNPTTSTYTKKVDFEMLTKGAHPYGSLVQASNGKLYGMTSEYGLVPDKGGFTSGLLFEFDPVTNIFTNKIEFDPETNGSTPFGSLVQASNGKLYGMTSSGGTEWEGVLFEYDPVTNVFIKKVEFDGGIDGGSPYGSIIQASNGKLYGLTSSGGLDNIGVLFEYDPSTSTYNKRLDFYWSTYGNNPYGSLMQASDGKLYCMTSHGGYHDDGVLIEYDPITSISTVKKEFTFEIERRAKGSLMQASNGKLYGITYSDGSQDPGILFEYDYSVEQLIGKSDLDETNLVEPASDPRLIEICVPPAISTDPVDVTTCSNTAVYFSTAATGNGLAFQWEVDEGAGFTAISDNTIYDNATTNSLDITTASYIMNGFKYRCKVTSTCPAISIYSSQATLTLDPLPETPVITQNGDVLHSDAVTGNQWYDQAGLISGATDQDYTVLSDGNYYVVVTINGCSSEQSNSINVVLTGTDFYQSNSVLKVYPNPVSHELVIEIENTTEPTNFEILNSTGQVIYTGILFNRATVQTKDFPQGVYIIKAWDGRIVDFRKIVKE